MSEYGTWGLIPAEGHGLQFFSKFATVLVAMMASTIPVSIVGVKFAMRVAPFWTPEQFSQ